MNTKLKQLCTFALIGSIGFASVGCETKAGTGALVGAGSGAALGAIIGNQSHGRGTEGALIGAGVGALGGALVGNELDKQDREKEKERQREDQYAGYDYRRDGSSDPITKRDVVKWTQRGTRDDVIIDRIERSGTVFHLSRGDEQDLRDAGVSEMVIQEMRATARR
jgi:5'-3' exoribonuclease 2